MKWSDLKPGDALHYLGRTHEESYLVLAANTPPGSGRVVLDMLSLDSGVRYRSFDQERDRPIPLHDGRSGIVVDRPT